MFTPRFWIFAVALLTLASPLSAAEGKTPDRRSDAEYLDHQIKHLSNADLFAALDLDRPGLEAVKIAAEAADYPAAYRAWAAYWEKNHAI